MQNTRCFVQFTYLGGEHQLDKGKNFKRWNQGRHPQKFLMTDSDFIFDNRLAQKTLFHF